VGVRISEIDGVAFARQETAARYAAAGFELAPQRAPWLQVLVNTFAEPTSLAGGFLDLCAAVESAFDAAGQPTPATSVTYRGRDVRWSTKSAEKVLEDWAAGVEDRLTLDFNTADMTRQAEIGVVLEHPGQSVFGVAASSIEIVVWTMPDVAAVAERLLPVISQLAVSTDAAYAAATYDFGQKPYLPFEMWHGIGDGCHTVDRHARGYYWANLLSHRHLQALGGLAEARRRTAEAGLQIVAVRDTPGAELAWIRMLCHVDSVSDQQMEAMRSLLAPALPPARYRFYNDIDHPVRVLKDPGEAYLVPPTGTTLYRLTFDDDDELVLDSPQAQALQVWYDEARKHPEWWTAPGPADCGAGP
jgi:hypothetical protein